MLDIPTISAAVAAISVGAGVIDENCFPFAWRYLLQNTIFFYFNEFIAVGRLMGKIQ